MIYAIKRGDESLAPCLVLTGGVFDWVSRAAAEKSPQFLPVSANTCSHPAAV